MKAKHDELAEALDGMFDDHHGELARMLLDQIAFLDERITPLIRPGRRAGRGDARRLGRRRRRDHRPRRRHRPGRRRAARRPGWRRSPASARTWPAPSSRKQAWT